MSWYYEFSKVLVFRYRALPVPSTTEDGMLSPWKRVTVVLEVLHERKHAISSPHLLMTHLFDLLHR